MSKRFNESKKFENVVTKAHIEMVVDYHRLHVIFCEDTDDKKQLEENYARSMKTYFTLKKMYKKSIQDNKAIWLKNKVNMNRVVARINSARKITNE